MHFSAKSHALRWFARATGIGIASVLLLQVLPASATSSWNPSLLVNTESFETIDSGDGTTNVELRFGSSTNALKFLTNGLFQFTNSLSVLGGLSGSYLTIDHQANISGALTVKGATLLKSGLTVNGNVSGSTLRVSGPAAVHGALSASGSIRTDGDLTINDDLDSNDAVLTFGNTAGSQTIKFLNSSQQFQFSKGISIVGTISGSRLSIDGNATFSGSVLVKNNIAAKGTVSGSTINGFGLGSCNGASQKLVFNSATGKFECGTDLNTATSPWSNTGSLQNGFDARYVKKSGDTMTGALTVKGALSGASLTIDGNITLHGVTYSAPSSQGGANTFLKNDGNGNLTWGTTSVGNGSGGIISLHPEYPNAVYFSSGSSFIGQLTMSGGTSALENSYVWTSSKGTLQNYWVSVRVRLPDNFSSWDPVKPIEFRYKTGVASSSNNGLKVMIRDTTGAYVALTGGAGLASTSWATAQITGPQAAGTWTPKGYITVYVKLVSDNTAGANAAAGFLNLNYETTTP